MSNLWLIIQIGENIFAFPLRSRGRDVEQTLLARSPQRFSEAELQNFIAMVRAGDQIGGGVLEQNVRDAQCLVFLKRGSCLTGVAALKNPIPRYRQTIKSNSGVSVEASDFPFELAYVVVLSSARGQGLSGELTRAALSASGGSGVFATARTDNAPMHATLEKLGFEKVGSPYASGRRNHQLQVFVRPAPPSAAADRS